MEYLARLWNTQSAFTLNVQDVVFQDVFMHPTFPEIDECSIDRITPVREKTLILDLSLFRGSVPSAFWKF